MQLCVYIMYIIASSLQRAVPTQVTEVLNVNILILLYR